MASGYKVNGIDLDELCEPYRTGVTAASFGGSGKFVGSGSIDLVNKYATFPTGFGYAKPAFSGSPFLVNGTEVTPPSVIGRRPTSNLVFGTTGSKTFFVYRTATHLHMKDNNGNELVRFSPADLSLTYIPHVLVFFMCGGGGGGGGGAGTTDGGGGGGGGKCVGFVEVPLTENAAEGVKVTLGNLGTRGTGGVSGGATDGGKGGDSQIAVDDSYIVAKGGSGGLEAPGAIVDGGKIGYTGLSDRLSLFGGVSGGYGDTNGRAGGDCNLTAAISPEITLTHNVSGGSQGDQGGGAGGSSIGRGGNSTSSTGASGVDGGGGSGGRSAMFDGRNGGSGGYGRIEFWY